MVSAVARGAQAPFTIAIPAFPFNCFLSLSVFHKWAITDEMFRAAAMVAVLLIHLGILNCSSKSYHEFLHYSLESIRVITLLGFAIISIFFFQLCQTYSRFPGRRLVALKFPQGKEAGSLGLDELSVGWNLELCNSSMESSFSASLAALR